ncbi:beta-lactamase family protein [Verrucomicrobia bacterium]|nr:beta-lactamase family protein [Verrucomicrobiota bacterium]
MNRRLFLKAGALIPAVSMASETGKLDFDPFNQVMEKFMSERKVPGGSLAVSRNGRLLYAKGYGLADREKKEPVNEETLFRIASISKPITSAAIMKLISMGSLKLDTPILPYIELYSNGPFPESMDARWREITVRHLLHHTGGWDRNAAFDPMFKAGKIAKEMKEDAPASGETIVRYMLRQPLQFDPGKGYAYSNFGYLLLGRILEQVTGQGYEHWVKQWILKPMGIRNMRTGRTQLKHRASNESRYYMAKGVITKSVFPDVKEKVGWPYGGFYLEPMDSHGSWIASPTDLVKFADGMEKTEELGIFSKEHAEQLYQPPPPPVSRIDGKLKSFYYGAGWLVRSSRVKGGKPNLWHNGSLPGTYSLLVRVRREFTWSVIFNQRSKDKSKPDPAIDQALHQAAKKTFGY